jgi:hypothetical protein
LLLNRLRFLNFWFTGVGVDRNESGSQPGYAPDDEDIELPDEVEDSVEDDA